MCETSKKIIHSYTNSKVKHIRKLKSKKERRKRSQFFVDRVQAIVMATNAGYAPRMVLYSRSFFTDRQSGRMLKEFINRRIPCFEILPDICRSLSERDRPSGLIAIYDEINFAYTGLRPGENSILFILDRIQCPANAGTILRLADSVNADFIIMVEPCVDQYDSRTIDASMGSLFNVPVERIDQFEIQRLISFLKRLKYLMVGTEVHEGKIWCDLNWSSRSALILGNEKEGISSELRQASDILARIPIYGKSESLNVGVAGGVFAYSWISRFHYKE